MYGTPAVAGDMLFIGSCASVFTALDVRTGQVRWTYDIRPDGNQTSFHGDALVTDDLVLTGTDGGPAPTAIGHLYAFAKSTGKVRWKHQVKFGVMTDVVRAGELIYAVTMTDDLLCLELATGRLRWSLAGELAPHDRMLSHAPVVANGILYFGTLKGQVKALDARNGRLVWVRDLGAPVTSSPLINDKSLYVGTGDGTLYQLSLSTGTINNRVTLNGAINTAPVLIGSVLLVLHGKDEQDQTLSAVDVSLQKTIWQRADNWCTKRPVLWRGVALMGNRRGEVTAVQPGDGAGKWTQKLRGPLRSVTGNNDLIYAANQRGVIFAFRPES